MNISKEDVIKHIEEKKNEREKSLLGLEMSTYEHDMQNNMVLGVNMVIRWLREGLATHE